MSQLNVLYNLTPHEPTLETLRADDTLKLVRMDRPSSGDWPVELLAEAEVLFCSGRVPSNLDAARKLKWVQIGSAGYEKLFAHDLPARQIRASNALGTFDVPIGEWCLAMMIDLARDVPGMLRHQRDAVWDPSPRFQREVRGSTVGFWGYGGLARETARLCKVFNMTVHALTRSGATRREDKYVVSGTGDPDGELPDRVFSLSEKKAFLAGLDFLVMAMPLTDASRGAVGEAELKALPSHAYLLNPARGPLIQEQALLAALRDGWIAGAALDTHFHYPLPADHPLWSMPNVIITPHIAGSGGTQTYPQRIWDIFQQNLQRFRTGQPLLNELSPSQLRGE